MRFACFAAALVAVIIDQKQTFAVKIEKLDQFPFTVQAQLDSQTSGEMEGDLCSLYKNQLGLGDKFCSDTKD